MRVDASSPLPIDLAAHVHRAFPEAEVRIGVGLADLEQTDALVCLLRDRIDEALLARAPKLRVVATCAVGTDNIDLAACARAGVVVANTPDVLTEATAELAFVLMLAAARRVAEGDRLVRSGAWTGWALDQLLGVELAGKTAGVVGYGRIGQAFARRARAFDMRVIHGRDLDALFAEADVVSLHCPLTPATYHLVDARRLALMKPTAILVNTARGGCVDSGALAEALAAGRLFAAGLDVYEGEPAVDPRLLASPRAVLAPHIGSATTRTRIAMAQLCADAVIDVLSGRVPANVVRR